MFYVARHLTPHHTTHHAAPVATHVPHTNPRQAPQRAPRNDWLNTCHYGAMTTPRHTPHHARRHAPRQGRGMSLVLQHQRVDGREGQPPLSSLHYGELATCRSHASAKSSVLIWRQRDSCARKVPMPTRTQVNRHVHTHARMNA